MSFVAENWYWIVAALASGGGLLWLQLREGPGAGDLSPQDAVMLINREKAVVVDVSEPAEYAAGHVKGSRNVPLGQLAEGAKGLPSNKQLPVILVCATGSRAVKAAAKLKALGYDKARVLRGGVKAWREAQLPVDKASAA